MLSQKTENDGEILNRDFSVIEIVAYWIIPMSLADERFKDAPNSLFTNIGFITVIAFLIFALNEPADPTVTKVALTSVLGAVIAFGIQFIARYRDGQLPKGTMMNGFMTLIVCMFFFVSFEVFEVAGSRFEGVNFFIVNALLAGAITFLIWLGKSLLLDKVRIGVRDLVKPAVVVSLCMIVTTAFAMFDISQLLP